MSGATKHMARSHRSYRDTKATIGSLERSNYSKNISKQSKADSKIIPLLEKLKDGVAKMFNFKKQNRG